MRTSIVFCGLFLLVVCCLSLDSKLYSQFKVGNLDKPAIDDQKIEEINAKNLPWKAGRNARFEGKTLADAKRLLGVRYDVSDPNPFPIKNSKSKSVGDFPTSFDARTKWPGCVHPVLNQGDCGSCWAFGASEALSDRFCIDSNSSVNVVLSPQSLVSCSGGLDNACSGGIPNWAWLYMANPGLVTLDCFPYESGKNGTVPDCRSTCENGQTGKLYRADYDTIYTNIGETAIQEALLNGPIEGTFLVFEDFLSYKSGVYIRNSLDFLGGHAIKIVGWGVTSEGVEYWTCQNSWGTDWGMDGFFNILRGENECGIETDAVSGNALLN